MRKVEQKSSILIIEDDHRLSFQLSEMLQASGFKTNTADDGEKGLAVALGETFNLILLDVGLPGTDGFTLLKSIRQQQQTPVLMLTAHGAEEERITGLKNGADDYLSKPFNFTELLLRIEAILKRSQGLARHDLFSPRLDRHGLVLNRQLQQVRFNETPVTLTAVQFRLLWTLLSHAGQTLSKPMLYRQVLERDFSRYDRSLDMHISRIRRKLINAGMAADCIQTLHGSGYRLQ